MKLQLTIQKTDAVFQVTYKAKRFSQLKHIRGKYTNDQFPHLMKLVPPNIDKLEAFKNHWKGKVEYQLNETKSETLFTHLMQEYFNFYFLRTELDPIIDGTAGKALNQIITKLRNQAADDEEVKALFTLMLQNWDDIPKFYRDQLELRQINSNINIILNAIKNGTSNSKTRAEDLSDAYQSSNKK